MRSGRREVVRRTYCHKRVCEKTAFHFLFVRWEASFVCEKGEHGWGVITEKHSSIGQRKQLESDSQATGENIIAGTWCSLHHRWGVVVVVSERMRDSFRRERSGWG